MKQITVSLVFMLVTGTALAAGTVAGTVASTATEAKAAAGSAAISGKITLEGTAPARQKIQMAADPVCLQQHSEAVFSEEVVSNNGALQNVFVYVKEGVTGNFPAPKEAVVIDQQGCTYHPHVFGIQVGQLLEIRNSDSTLHNINAQPTGNKRFNVAQPVKGMKTMKTFDQPEVMVPFKCNVHPWMSAYGGVVNHPFFAVSDANGAISISGLPAGTYAVEAWHEKLGTQTQSVTVKDGETKSISFTFKAK